MNWKTFLAGLLLLLLAPALVLWGFAAYTHATNAMPQAGLLHVDVTPQVLWPGDRAAVTITFAGDQIERVAPPPKLDIAFLIDVSGSMAASLPDMARAAHRMAQDIASAGSDLVRLSLVRFDSEAEIITPWTAEPAVLQAGLQRLTPMTGQNDTRQAFAVLDTLLRTARPEARKVLVFYTDGHLAICPPPACSAAPMSEAEMSAAAQMLRSRGLHIYAVTPPTHASPFLVELTGAPTQVLTPASLDDLINKFRLIAQAEIGVVGEQAVLLQLMDGRHFTTPVASTAWRVTTAGDLSLEVGALWQKPMVFTLPLEPKTSGQWRVGLKPPSLRYVDAAGKAQHVEASRRPALLVITWWILLFALLPAGLWLWHFLTSRPNRRLVSEPEPALPEIRSPTPASLLPIPLPLTEPRMPPVPTLFLGLGESGRQALHAVCDELRRAHLGGAGQPYRFVCLDVAPPATERHAAFEEWPGYPIDEVTLPRQLRDVSTYLPRPGALPEHLRWFNPQQYDGASREALRFVDGANADRALARLALFQWLQEGSLFGHLQQECARILDSPSVDGTRQMIVLASRSEGVGSSWFVDMGRLLRRIVRSQQSATRPFVPDIIGILTDLDPPSQGASNRAALDIEIRTAQLAGALPQRTGYGPGEALFEHTDREAPYSWLLSAASNDAVSTAWQCGQVGATLVERSPRLDYLHEVNVTTVGPVIATQATEVQVLAEIVRPLIAEEVFVAFLASDILLAVPASPSGSYQMSEMPQSTAPQGLQRWAGERESDDPWQCLLRAALEPQETDAFLHAVRSRGEANPEWLRQAFAASLTQWLRGWQDREASTWERGWWPGEAIVVLRLFAHRLQTMVGPQMQNLEAEASYIDLITQVASMAEDASQALQTWTQALCQCCTAAWQRQEDLLAKQRRSYTNAARQVLGMDIDRQQLRAWADLTFTRWLAPLVRTAALRERLFFSARAEPDRLRLVLRSYLDAAQEYSDPVRAAEALQHYAQRLADLAPVTQIASALATLEPARRDAVARGLVAKRTPMSGALLVLPSARATAPTMQAFAQAVVEPAGQRQRLECKGENPTVIRRLAWQEEAPEPVTAPSLPVVQAADQYAERLRQRATAQYALDLPLFPPELRIAVANPVAFRSFARAYRAGHITRRNDAAGVPQWFFVDRFAFLTFAEHHSLAAAAAHYVQMLVDPPEDFANSPPLGDFTPLHAWSSTGRLPARTNEADLAALVAITVCEEA